MKDYGRVLKPESHTHRNTHSERGREGEIKIVTEREQREVAGDIRTFTEVLSAHFTLLVKDLITAL